MGPRLLCLLLRPYAPAALTTACPIWFYGRMDLRPRGPRRMLDYGSLCTDILSRMPGRNCLSKIICNYRVPRARGKAPPRHPARLDGDWRDRGAVQLHDGGDGHAAQELRPRLPRHRPGAYGRVPLGGSGPVGRTAGAGGAEEVRHRGAALETRCATAGKTALSRAVLCSDGSTSHRCRI